MKTKSSRSVVSELARNAGAEPRLSWPRRLFRAALKNWKPQEPAPSGLVMFAGENAPRDLDDPLSDPKVQARIGEAIAKRAKHPRR